MTFHDILSVGEKVVDYKPTPPQNDGTYMFSFTSGTTGDSKGVKLTHNNMMMPVETEARHIKDMTPEDSFLSYLPLAHAMEQGLLIIALYNGMRVGFYQGNPVKLLEDCALLQPTLFVSVPRLYNKVYSNITAKFGEATGFKKWLLDSAMKSKQDGLKNNHSYTHGCYDFLIFNKIKALFGGKVRKMVTGSAPIDQEVLDFLKIAFCCPLMEGYGLTETSATATISKDLDTLGGHVGGPIECIKIRLKDVPEMKYFATDKPYPRGELQCKGSSVFSGYYKRPDKTAEAFDKDGWFTTGDVGLIYPNGSIKIIDRVKNIFKLSQGEYIAPEKLENIYC